MNKQVTGGTVGIQWEPPLEGACPVLAYNIYYRGVSSPPSGESKRDLISIDGIINHYTLHLNCSHEYEINVTSMDGHMESDSSQTLKFKPSGGKLKIILDLESFFVLLFEPSMTINGWQAPVSLSHSFSIFFFRCSVASSFKQFRKRSIQLQRQPGLGNAFRSWMSANYVYDLLHADSTTTTRSTLVRCEHHQRHGKAILFGNKM